MAIEFKFERVLDSQDAQRAYAGIEAWLGREGTKIKDRRPPASVTAVHGRALQVMGWKKDAKKTMRFDLQPSGSGVRVSVTITPPALNAGDVSMQAEQARANWQGLLAELWASLGETGAIADAAWERRDLGKRAAVRGRSMMGAGAVLLVIGFIIMAITFSLARTTGLYLVPTGFMVAGILALLNGWWATRMSR